MKTKLVISNFKNLGEVVTEPDFTHAYIGDNAGQSSWQFIRMCLRAHLVILNIDQQRLLLASLIKWLWPLAKFKLISVDLILRPPKSRQDRLKVAATKLAFSRVDKFILYFRNLKGYERFYGIGPERAVYVPFKVNGWELQHLGENKSADGEYVLCAGRTLRDVNTFVEAMAHLRYPAILLQQKKELLEAHGTSTWAGPLPPNVTLVVDDSDSLQSFYGFLKKARVVVIPRFRGDIAATGLSTYLVAMALQRCVVLSSGPGAEDVLDDEASFFPPEDVPALTKQIDLLWNNQELRARQSASARRYAESVAGEKRLMSDIWKQACAA